MIRFTLNGRPVQTEYHPLTRLIDVIREELGDTSVKEGCGEGECGACSILIDGKLANSCLVPVVQVGDRSIVTIAGFRETPRGKALIDAFAREGAVQCGFCIPGMVMAGEAILTAHPAPDDGQIRAGLAGNLCRCTGYDLIVRAIASAARESVGLW
jgi:aerobic carbon-monoxide dehydrogenase small subunit